MIVDDSFKFHSLSLTIVSAFEQLMMIVDKITPGDRVIENKYGACLGQRFLWHFKFLVKKLGVKDTEAYQEMIRTGYETFFEILTAS